MLQTECATMNIAAGRAIDASLIVTALQRSAALQRRQSLRMSRSPEVGLMGVASAAMFALPREAAEAGALLAPAHIARITSRSRCRGDRSRPRARPPRPP